MLNNAIVFARRILLIASVVALTLLCGRPAAAQMPVHSLAPPNPPSQRLRQQLHRRMTATWSESETCCSCEWSMRTI